MLNALGPEVAVRSLKRCDCSLKYPLKIEAISPVLLHKSRLCTYIREVISVRKSMYLRCLWYSWSFSILARTLSATFSISVLSVSLMSLTVLRNSLISSSLRLRLTVKGCSSGSWVLGVMDEYPRAGSSLKMALSAGTATSMIGPI